MFEGLSLPPSATGRTWSTSVAASGAEDLGFVTDAEGFFVRRVTTAARVRLRARCLRPVHDLSGSTDLVVR